MYCIKGLHQRLSKIQLKIESFRDFYRNQGNDKTFKENVKDTRRGLTVLVGAPGWTPVLGGFLASASQKL